MKKILLFLVALSLAFGITQSGGGSGGVSDHGALTGLTDDDHSAVYVNLTETSLVTLTSLTVNGTISADVFIGDGSNLTGISGTGTVTDDYNNPVTLNAAVAMLAGATIGNSDAGWHSLEIGTEEVTISGGLTVVETITANAFVGDGSALTGISASGGGRMVSLDYYIGNGSDAAATFTSFVDAAYSSYILDFSGGMSIDSDRRFGLYFSDDGGSTWITASCSYSVEYSYGNSASYAGAAGQDYIWLHKSQSGGAHENFSGYLQIWNLNNSVNPAVNYFTNFVVGTTFYSCHGGGTILLEEAESINAIKVAHSIGSMNSGCTVTLWGVK